MVILGHCEGGLGGRWRGMCPLLMKESAKAKGILYAKLWHALWTQSVHISVSNKISVKMHKIVPVDD